MYLLQKIEGVTLEIDYIIEPAEPALGYREEVILNSVKTNEDITSLLLINNAYSKICEAIQHSSKSNTQSL